MLLTILVSVLAVIFTAIVMVTYLEYRKIFSVRGREATKFYDHFLSKFPDLFTQAFSCPSGGETLRGIHLSYSDRPKALVVMVHGYGWNMEHYFPQAEYIARKGYQVCLFDGVGTGRSSGKNIKGMPQHMLDVCAVLDYVEQTPNLCELPLLLYGHSWGGYAANAAPCKKDYPIRALISIAGYNDPLAVIKTALRKRFGPYGLVLLPPILFFQWLSFGKYANYSSVCGLGKTKCPVLLLHSSDDEVVLYEGNFSKLKSVYSSNARFRLCTFEGKNHNLGIPMDVNEERRQLQRTIRETESGDDIKHLTARLWALQMIVDEELLDEFIQFYNDCLVSS